jgi:hypothetical protein
VFEETLLCFLETFMILDVGLIKKVNWHDFFQNLYDNLTSNADWIEQWPKCPSMLEPPKYGGPVVVMTNWLNFIDRDGLKN